MHIPENISKREIWITLGIVALLFFVLRSLLLIIFLTFIFSYIADSAIKVVEKHKPFSKHHKILTSTVFLLFVGLLVLIGIIIIPSSYQDTLSLFRSLPSSFNVIDFIKNDIIAHIPLLNRLDDQTLTNFLTDQEIARVSIPDVTSKITSFFGTVLLLFIDIFVSFVLAFFIVLEKQELKTFFRKVEESRLGKYYLWLKPYALVLLDSFGKTFESQALIALINSILTIIGLYFLGLNNLLAFWFIVFIFSFIPVFGVFVSTIPIMLVGFFVGGFWMVLEIILLVTGVHFIEAYFLNPKIYASRARIPITIAFVALVVGEFVGQVWGLLLAIPTLYFLYNVFVAEKVKNVIDK